MISHIVNLDVRIFETINAAHTPALDWAMARLTWLGDAWVAAPVLLAIAVWKVPRRQLATVIVASALAMSLSGALNSWVKRAVDRPRPVRYFALQRAPSGSPAFAVHVVGKPLRSHSFPSGHTNTAFSAAVVLIVCLGGLWWLALIPAAVVGYSRIYLGVHFPADVAAGAALGVLVTWAVLWAGLLLGHRLDHRGHADPKPPA